MDTDVSTASPPTRPVGRIARRTERDAAPTASITSLFDAEPHRAGGSGLGKHSGLGHGTGANRLVLALLAAAVVLALAASVGVGVLWSANRKLAAEVEMAVGQAAAARSAVGDLRATVPEAEAVDVLARRVQGVEEWTGLPADGGSSGEDLDSRLTDTAGDTSRLQHQVRDGLADVRSGLAALEADVAGRQGAASTADLDALRQEVGGLRTTLDDLSGDVSTLCWALSYRPEVVASC